MRSSLIVIYLSVFVCLFVCLSVRSSYWPALKRSGLQNFSVNGHFAHYKPTKKRLWKPKNQKLFAVAVLAFQLQLQLRLQLQLQRCQKSLFSSFGAHFGAFVLGTGWSGSTFYFRIMLSTLCQSDSLKIKLYIIKCTQTTISHSLQNTL